MTFSPSAISTFESCERAWAWHKLDHVPKESSPYQEFGTEVHRQLEHYLKSGTMLDLTTPAGECALAFLPHLPKPLTPGLLIEQPQTIGPFHGIPDILLPGVVLDHKTTSDHKWAKLSLATDIQAAIYAYFNFHLYNPPKVKLQWNYVTRRRPKCLPVIQEVTREDITPTLERAWALTRRMQARIDSGAKALDLPPNPLHCEAYGGCQHRGRCNLTTEQKVTAIMTQGFDPNQGVDAFAQSMQQLLASSPQPPNLAGPAINPPGPQGPPQGPPPGPPPQQAQAPWQPPPQSPPTQNWAPPPAGPPQGPPPGWQPPQQAQAPWQPPPQSPPPQPKPELSPEGMWRKENGQWVPNGPPPPAQQTYANQGPGGGYNGPPAQAAEPPKKGPGRPRKNAAAGIEPWREALAAKLDECADILRGIQ